jgi:two-component sensor histidine kinase
MDAMKPRWIEKERLAALHGYGILDAPDDPALDDFVEIAAHVCDTPISVVNLIDATRQWFAAEKGLGVRQTGVDVSICAHAILQSDLFVVPDLTRDARFGCNPLVAGDPRLRFYAGALLETPEGLPLGTLCVLDYTPRPAGLTAQQARMLRALARQVMVQLELRRFATEKELLVQEAHHRVKNSLQMVQSLLTLQARAAAPEAAAQLRASAGRVLTFGAMHEQLYRVGAAVEVELGAYLGELVAHQKAALASMLEGREVVFSGAKISWPSSDAPALGLIMMELVTNALKYGEGQVTATLRQAGDAVELAVADEGQGLPDDFEPTRSTGLGMRVIGGLLRGRTGAMQIDRSGGHTRFVVTLPRPARRPG